MASFKGIKSAFEEHKILRLLGPYWETEILYDPQENRIAANNRAVGTKQVVKPPFVLLGNLQHMVTMTQMKNWAEERIAELNAENNRTEEKEQ